MHGTLESRPLHVLLSIETSSLSVVFLDIPNIIGSDSG